MGGIFVFLTCVGVGGVVFFINFALHFGYRDAGTIDTCSDVSSAYSF